MKIGLNILVLLMLFSCSATKKNIAKDCIENEVFKKKYFTSIKRVEDYVLGKGNKKSFQSSLKFISKYTQVSYNKMLNYNNSYAKFEDYEVDKKKWLEWYENNKCSNLK
ncbi:hypothetical protein [Pedobacter kyonggii]|uniref:Lipoprotein n=1 Tax=Pedobacter kyonggii TaxID=1926871 RepID=A0A4V2JGU7_9SPHI|nr:hypothetical protein [Pedobacter kyonggii]TBO42077.1 hypothetical protein EYS08_11115 [Pedobacter kyonggii]